LLIASNTVCGIDEVLGGLRVPLVTVALGSFSVAVDVFVADGFFAVVLAVAFFATGFFAVVFFAGAFAFAVGFFVIFAMIISPCVYF
jgi:hypothetical protein